MNSEHPATQQRPVPKASPWRWSVTVPTFLAVLALMGSAMLWEKLSRIQSQLARQSADAGQQSLEAKAWAKQAQESVKDSAARLGLLESRVGEVALQRGQLDELMQSLSRSRDENLVVDIESAIRLAQQQSQLTGSVQPLLAALQSSQMRLTKVAQPRLAPLLRAIVRDIEQIKATPVTDTPTLLIKIDELVRAVDNLALLNAVGATTSNNATTKQAAATPETLSWARAISMSWWEKMLNDLWRNAQGLVRISRIERPEASLLAPEQSYFVRENLKLRLLNVRLAVLARHFESAQADMNQVTRDLNKYFDVASGQGPLTVTLAREILAQSKNTEIPRIDATLAALTTAAAGR